MNDSIIVVLKDFCQFAFDGECAEAEKLVTRKVEDGTVDRAELVDTIASAGIDICDSKTVNALQRYNFGICCFEICFKINRKDDVREGIKKLLSVAHRNLGSSLVDSHAIDEARKHLYKALELNPENSSAYADLGFISASLGRVDEAEKHFEKALCIRPKDIVVLTNLGAMLIVSQKFEEAKIRLQEALELDPKNATAHMHLGLVFNKLGKMDESEKLLKKSLELARGPVEICCHYNLALTQIALDKLQEAEAHYAKALELDPKEPRVHANLGWLLLKENRFDEAALHFSIANRIFGEKHQEKDAVCMKAFGFWIKGFKLWQNGNIVGARNNYMSACRAFVASGRKDLALIPAFIAQNLMADEEYTSCIKSGDLLLLKKGILRLCRRMEKTAAIGYEEAMPELDLLSAKMNCLKFLRDVLLFRRVERGQLEKAKRVFVKNDFVESYEAANAIDTFRIYLNHFAVHRSLSAITKEQEKELFKKLISAIDLDGVLTQRLAGMIVERLKPELYTAVAGPVMKEELKTRKTLARKMDQIGGELERIHIALLGFGQEITVKEIASGELELAFPSPLGTYKIHIPLGRITTQDIARIRMEVSAVLERVAEEARKTSSKLCVELERRKSEIARKIFTRIRRIRGRNSVNADGNGSGAPAIDKGH